MNILLGDFNAKVGGEDILKLTATRVHIKLAIIIDLE
jgi:hypothetical protein